jgi:hypothetical protein
MKEKGTTLLELILVIFILNVFLFSIYSIYSVVISCWDIGIIRCEILPQSRITLEKISSELQTAKKSSIYLPLPSPLYSPWIEFENQDSEIIRFYVNSQGKLLRANLTRGENPQEDEGKPLTSQIFPGLIIYTPLFREEGGIIEIILTAKKYAGTSSEEKIFLKTKVKVRN